MLLFQEQKHLCIIETHHKTFDFLQVRGRVESDFQDLRFAPAHAFKAKTESGLGAYEGGWESLVACQNNEVLELV